MKNKSKYIIAGIIILSSFLYSTQIKAWLSNLLDRSNAQHGGLTEKAIILQNIPAEFTDIHKYKETIFYCATNPDFDVNINPFIFRGATHTKPDKSRNPWDQWNWDYENLSEAKWKLSNMVKGSDLFILLLK